MKRYVSLVCNEFVTRDYTVLYLVSNWLRLDPIKMHAKIFGMDMLSDLGHAGPAICDLIYVLRTVLLKNFSLPGTEWGIEQGPCGIIKTFDMLCTRQRKSFCNSMLESLYSFLEMFDQQ